MNKKFALLLTGLLLLTFAAQAQFANQELSKIARIDNPSGWITFKSDVAGDPSRIFETHKTAFGLSSNDEMREKGLETDRLGFTHIRYQQYFKNVPVMGAEYLIHSKNGLAETGNGKIVSGLNLTVTPVIGSTDAIEKALSFTAAQSYMWEDPANEEMLKHITGDPDATYRPKAELMIVDRTLSGKAGAYRLAWKVNVYAETPISYRDIYIDAQTGDVYHFINRLITDDVPGTAETKYTGTQSIVSDSMAPGQYRLRETGRGSGIETYDMNQGTNYGSAVDFTDSDNYWNNVNADLDEVATDAHWGAEMTYDYYFQVHNRLSFNDLDAKLVSFVHYDVDYDNAFWDGQRMTYGDGAGNYGPFTALDVCAHEISHGVTEYTANLIYMNEPGALNEAFSDIFSAAVEFFALDSLGDWLVGEDFDLVGDGFRNMQDPKADQQPDTYLGQYWYSGTFDNGGVHTNSGVANYWFYLLSEGGSGTNDNNHFYSITGISIDSAELIAYRALSVYLTQNSNYMDARMATLQAAADIFGHCSDEYIQCANAWHAVGVGMAIADYDFSMANVTAPVTECGMTNETVSVELIYNGCNVNVPAGDSIYFYYRLDGGVPVQELHVVATDIYGGDTLSYTFTALADVSAIGFHSIDTWLGYVNDTMFYNDTIHDYSFENRLYQNVDVGAVSITEPASSCNLSNDQSISVDIEFFGCDFLPSGEAIKMAYSVDGGPAVYDTLVLTADLYPETPLNFTFGVGADLSVSKTYIVSVWTEYLQDTMTGNDHAPNIAVKKPTVFSDTVITFEESQPDQNFLVHTTPYSHAFVSTSAEYTGMRGFLMTGGNPMAYYTMIEFPNGSNTWSINEFLSAKIDFCIDATAWSSAHMSWDMKQTHGGDAYSLYIGAGDYTVASNLRVLVNETNQIGGTYNPTTSNADPFTKHFADLSSFAGSVFTLTFETRNLSKDTIIFVMDNAYLDNIRFSEAAQTGLEETFQTDALHIYPNPSDGKFNIEYFATDHSTAIVETFDHLGRLVRSEVMHVYAGQNNLNLELADQPAGIYMVRINAGNEVRTGKVIIQ